MGLENLFSLLEAMCGVLWDERVLERASNCLPAVSSREKLEPAVFGLDELGTEGVVVLLVGTGEMRLAATWIGA